MVISISSSTHTITYAFEFVTLYWLSLHYKLCARKYSMQLDCQSRTLASALPELLKRQN
jgi:hypothetical protein